jgi:acyl-CoA synthetase (AMP-forming)/AMP-acid ligase II
VTNTKKRRGSTGVLGPIASDTRLKIAEAIRASREGLHGGPIDFTPPVCWSLWELLARRAEEIPEKPYIIFCDDDSGIRETLSFERVARRARRVAAFMKDRLLLGPGDVVAVADLYNHPDTVVLMFAAWALGVIVVPINMREDRRRQQHILRHSGAQAVFARDRQDHGALDNYLKRMTALAGDLGISHVVQMGGEDRRAAYWLDEIEAQAESEFAEVFPIGTEALLVYTAGVTGPPKGVVLNHSLLYGVRAFVAAQELRAEDVILCTLPLFHVQGIVAGVLAAVHVGATLVLNRRFEAATFLERVEDEGITVTSVVPAMLAEVCTFVEEQGIKPRRDYPDALQNLRRVFCGGGQLFPATASEVYERLGVRIGHGWGMTETSCWGCMLPPDLSDGEYRKLVLDSPFPSIGVPNGSLRMGIVEPTTGAPLAASEVGEIVTAGPGLMQGYFKNGVANEKAFGLSVLQTGDQGCFEEFRRDDGSRIKVFYIIGRFKETIERGGEKYSTMEIDTDIMRIPVVEQALAFGFRHNVYGQEVGAAIVVREGATLDEIAVWRHFMTLGYSWEKTPKVIRVLEDLPEALTVGEQRVKVAELFGDLSDEVFFRPDFWTKK